LGRPPGGCEPLPCGSEASRAAGRVSELARGSLGERAGCGARAGEAEAGRRERAGPVGERPLRAAAEWGGKD
jgi:hypothetical protein